MDYSFVMASSEEDSDGDYKYSLPWQQLTDDILLVILSYLDAKSLVSAAATCQHWYRIADDDSLWKSLLLGKIKLPHLQERVLHAAEEEQRHGEKQEPGRWRTEFIRMEDEAPIVLSETLEAHTDEIYHINFSQSGNYFSTTGRDASVRVWKFGYPCTLYAENTDLDSILVYTRFSDFNRSETLLLVAGIASYILGADSCTLILSIKDLQILHAVSGSNANFRGCWLDDSSFLNGTHIFMPTGQRRFLIKKHTVKEQKKSDHNIQVLIGKMDAEGQQMMLLQPYCRTNDFARVAFLPNRCLHKPTASKAMSPLSEQFEFIDSEQQDESCEGNIKSELQVESSQYSSSIASCSGEEDVSPVLILANNTEEYPSTGFLSFYRVPELSETAKTYEVCENFCSADADRPGGMVGMRLSANNRYIAFNYRSCTKDEGDYDVGCYIKDIDLKVFDLHTMSFIPMVYTGHSATSEDHLSYIFPAVSDHYLASGSEVEKGFVWNRHYGNILGVLKHAPQPGNGGVNATVFHPNSEEVLITLGDDRKIKVWRSRRLLRELGERETTSTILNSNYHSMSDEHERENKLAKAKYTKQEFDRNCDQPDCYFMDGDLIDEEVVTCCIMKKKNRKFKK